MTWPTDAGRAQLGRALRLFAIAMLAQPLVAGIVSTWFVRFPLVAAVFVALEVTYREVFPTVPAPQSTARHAAPDASHPAASGPPSDQTYTPVTQSQSDSDPPPPTAG
jgi:hypothetical protein